MPSLYYERGDVRTRVNRLQQLYAALKQDRASFDSHWRDLSDFLMPRRSRWTTSDRNRGDKRNQNIIDSTGRFSARTLQSGLHAGLTSPARPWFKMTTPDPDLAKYQPVKEWLHDVTQRMLMVMLTSNLYNALPIIYGDMGVFGTAAMSMVDDDQDLFRCYPYPIGSYVIGLNNRGVATTFGREYQLTVRQLIQEFGLTGPNRTEIDWSHFSDRVRRAWDDGFYEQAIDVTWIVQPNHGADPTKLEAKYLPWESCHFETGQQDPARQFLKESGFRTFPVMAPRWDITGEDTYGTDCPGMTALGDVRQLQTMQRRKAQAIAKMIDPSLVGPPELKSQRISLLPGDVTFLAEREGQKGLRAIHEVGINLQHLTEDIGQTQYRVQRAFYEDLFLMLAQSDAQRGAQPVTAREVEERHEEKLIALGPVLERTNDELLDPMIARIYQMMEARGFIPAAPPQLQGVNIKAEYTSIMAQAQKLVGVVGLDRFVATAGNMVAVFPEVRHKIDIFQVIDNYGDALGIDPKIVIETDKARASLEAERKQQEAVQQAAAAKDTAAALKSAATAPMEGDTALSRLVGGAATIAQGTETVQ